MAIAEKIQFLLTAFGLFVGGFEGLANLNHFYAFISLIFILIAVIYLVLAVFYQKFKLKFKNQSDKFISLISGIFMFLSGISFALINIRSRIQYCYYLLGLFYFFIFPRLLKRNKYQVTLNDSGIAFGHILGKAQFCAWKRMEYIKLTPEMLEFQIKGKKIKKLFLVNFNDLDFGQLERRIKEIADLNKFRFRSTDLGINDG